MDEKYIVGDLVGKFAFLEQSNPNERQSSYYDGEYLILHQTPHTIQGVKPIPNYGGHETRNFPLTGQHAYRVHKPYTDRAAIERFASDLSAFIESGKICKPQWCGTVYTGAGEVLRQVRRLLDAPKITSGKWSDALLLKPGTIVSLGEYTPPVFPRPSVIVRIDGQDKLISVSLSAGVDGIDFRLENAEAGK